MYTTEELKTILSRYAQKADYDNHDNLQTAGRKRIVASLRSKLEFPSLRNILLFNYPEFSEEEVRSRILTSITDLVTVEKMKRINDIDPNAERNYINELFNMLRDSKDLYYRTALGNHNALSLLKRTDSGLYIPDYIRI